MIHSKHVLLVLLIVCGCGSNKPEQTTSRTIITTLPVLGLIINPVAANFEVQVLLKEGQSPHGFQVSPSQAQLLNDSPLLVYAHSDLDGWAASLAAHDTLPLWNGDRDLDVHYWTDPVAVLDALRTLTDSLCLLQKDTCPVFRRKATAFSVRIDSVSILIAKRLEAVQNECVVVAHPFMTQFLDRFKIRSVGPLQPLPGHDASPRTLSMMMDQATQLGCQTLLVQTAVDNRAMYAVARDLGIKVVEVDPLGTHQLSYESYLESLVAALLPGSE
jgi:ABC-type Zn uptake system ZnuABC Zn-binding protein ZnuA